ncbi:hypothetical protein HXX76_000080 [Chlamydomonas incerta]|nr:hypothetical protein HXX76_000080 [Chlamydomonas incerta]|eukprot:KAG2445462.1 hypothetical protein HXX76_000080 [Chlamydomonas incerta]
MASLQSRSCGQQASQAGSSVGCSPKAAATMSGRAFTASPAGGRIGAGALVQTQVVDCGLMDKQRAARRAAAEDALFLDQLCWLCTVPAGEKKAYRPERSSMSGSSPRTGAPSSPSAEGSFVDPLFLEELRRTLLYGAAKPAVIGLAVNVLVTVF